jgi:hypothetical protein
MAFPMGRPVPTPAAWDEAIAEVRHGDYIRFFLANLSELRKAGTSPNEVTKSLKIGVTAASEPLPGSAPTAVHTTVA